MAQERGQLSYQCRDAASFGQTGNYRILIV
jgi:hypothetical protein